MNVRCFTPKRPLEGTLGLSSKTPTLLMYRRRLDTIYAYIARHLPKNPQGEDAVKRLKTLC